MILSIKNAGAWPYVSLVLFILCAYSVYSVIDMSVTLQYGRDGYVGLEQNLKIVEKMLNLKMQGMSKDETISFVKQNIEKNGFLKFGDEKTNLLEIGVYNLNIRFEGNKFKYICTSSQEIDIDYERKKHTNNTLTTKQVMDIIMK